MAQNQGGQQTIIVVVAEVPSSVEPFGHATVSVGGDKAVGLVPNSDAQAAVAVATEAKTGLPTPVPGHVQEDSRTPKEKAIVRVTPEQAAEMRAYIKQSERSKQSWDPGFRNCAHYAEEVLRSGGVKVPSDISPGGLVGDLRKQYPQ